MLLHHLASAAACCAAASGLSACADGALPDGAGVPEPTQAASQDLAGLPQEEAGAGEGQKKGPGSPAVQPPIVSPELDPSNLVYGPAPQGQDLPAVAFGGDSYLVAWTDSRDSSDEFPRIFAARVAESGEAIDREGIKIAGYGYRPRVAFGGTNYLVVWDANGFIRGARVSPDGEVLDPGGIYIAGGVEPKVVFDGTSYFVTWTGFWDQAGINGARISTEGAVLDPGGIPLVASEAIEVTLQELGTDGEGVLLTWPEGGDLHAARIEQGVLVDPGGFAVATGVEPYAWPAVAFDGANYTVAWVSSYGSSPSVAAARVSPAGVVLDPAGIALSDALATDWMGISAVFDGTNTVVSWNVTEPSLETDIVAARVSPSGEALDPGGVLVSPLGGSLAAARGNAGLLVVNGYQSEWPGWPHVYGTRIDGNLATIGEVDRLLSTSVARQLDPAVSFDGQNFVTVWADERGLNRGIYAARVTPWGDVLDPEGIALGDAQGWDFRPTATFDGTNTVVVWQTTPLDFMPGWLYAARLSPGGVALDPAPIALPTPGFYTMRYTAASDGESTLIVLEHKVGEALADDLHAIRLGPDGALLPPLSTSAPGEQISSVPIAAPGKLRSPTLHFDGANYLLTWLEGESGAGQALRGARLSPAGDLLDPAGFAISEVAAGGKVRGPAAMVQLGANTLVVWAEDRNGTVNLYGAEISAAGAVLSPQSIAIGATLAKWGAYDGSFVRFDVADEGGRALVVWLDRADLAKPDLLGARVAPGGAVEPAFMVSDESGLVAEPRVASNGLGRSLVTYHRPAESHVPQVKARFVTSPGCSYSPASAGGTGAGAAAAPLALLALGALARRRPRAAAPRPR